MENDLIRKKDAITNIIQRDGDSANLGAFDADAAIEEIKLTVSVDAVPVVRCKDCKNFDSRNWYCYYWDYEPGSSPNSVDDDDYCSYGERKDEDAEIH